MSRPAYTARMVAVGDEVLVVLADGEHVAATVTALGATTGVVEVTVEPAVTAAAPEQYRPLCTTCGRPYSPLHDAAAAGPTVRHPFIPKRGST